MRSAIFGKTFLCLKVCLRDTDQCHRVLGEVEPCLVAKVHEQAARHGNDSAGANVFAKVFG